MFGTWQQLRKYQLDRVTVAGVDVLLQQVPVRNLGVLFDPNMTFESHVSSIVRSTTYHVRNISLIRRYLTVDSAKKLMNSLVTSRLDYCNSILAGVGDTQIKRLQRVQNYAARVVLQLPRTVDPPLDELHWLPIQYRVLFKIAVLVFKSLHGLAPDYLCDLLGSYEQSRTLRSRDNHLLRVPRATLPTAGDRTFRVHGPRIWNQIPAKIRSSKDLRSFKKLLKTFYYCKAFNQV